VKSSGLRAAVQLVPPKVVEAVWAVKSHVGVVWAGPVGDALVIGGKLLYYGAVVFATLGTQGYPVCVWRGGGRGGRGAAR
jgi:hypothetical protein